MIAAVDKRKNAQGLIRAFSTAYNYRNIPKDSKLYIVGKLNKDFVDYLENVIKECDIKKNKIIITGFISDKKLLELIQNSKASFFHRFTKDWDFLF